MRLQVVPDKPSLKLTNREVLNAASTAFEAVKQTALPAHAKRAVVACQELLDQWGEVA